MGRMLISLCAMMSQCLLLSFAVSQNVRNSRLKCPEVGLWLVQVCVSLKSPVGKMRDETRSDTRGSLSWGGSFWDPIPPLRVSAPSHSSYSTFTLTKSTFRQLSSNVQLSLFTFSLQQLTTYRSVTRCFIITILLLELFPENMPLIYLILHVSTNLEYYRKRGKTKL